jgi:hypothetical protein
MVPVPGGAGEDPVQGQEDANQSLQHCCDPELLRFVPFFFGGGTPLVSRELWFVFTFFSGRQPLRGQLGAPPDARARSEELEETKAEKESDVKYSTDLKLGDEDGRPLRSSNFSVNC